MMARVSGKLLRIVSLCALAWVVSACSELAIPTEPTEPMVVSFGVEPPPDECDKDCPPPPDECVPGDEKCPVVTSGRMTGGGFQINPDNVRITRGLTLHCDILLSNNLQINWDGGNTWHLEKESLDNVTCIDDPSYDPTPPVAPFDTFIARARGRLNGEDGSVITFRFIDDGEPGTTDEAHFTIYAPNQGPGQVPEGDQVAVLTVSGQLDGGNLQAHYDQPHGSRANIS